MGCLYKIDFENGKSYVGITMKTGVERFYWHQRSAGNSTKKNYLYNAMRKYPDRYSFKELAWSDDWYVLRRFEQEVIRHLGTKYPGGYNLTDGGEGTQGLPGPWKGKKRPAFSVEWRAKLSASLKGNKRAIGCVHTPEGKERMRLFKGRHHSEESKMKMSKSLKLAWKKRRRIA